MAFGNYFFNPVINNLGLQHPTPGAQDLQHHTSRPWDLLASAGQRPLVSYSRALGPPSQCQLGTSSSFQFQLTPRPPPSQCWPGTSSLLPGPETSQLASQKGFRYLNNIIVTKIVVLFSVIVKTSYIFYCHSDTNSCFSDTNICFFLHAFYC